MRAIPSLMAVVVLAAAAHAVSKESVVVSESLRAAAYETGRYAVRPVEGGYEAFNPGQRWRVHFDGRRFTTQPDAGGWTWGLQLLRYGFAGNERVVTVPGHTGAEGQRVTYDWDDSLQEWYVNDSRGMEHGYTVWTRPIGGAERTEGGTNGLHPVASEDVSLSFTLAVLGGLLPQVDESGRDLHFRRPDGAVVLTYSGLTVFDADGRELPARFETVPEGVCLTVDERGARYPLTVDPIAQQSYLKASNLSSGDCFGESVSVSGDTAVVGAYREGNESGAAYVFVRSGSTWTQQAYLKASNADPIDWFGRNAVCVSGDTIVVGAIFEGSSATGVNGDQTDNNAAWAGAAYVFVRTGTTWSQQAYLKASNTDAGDLFGGSVSVSGDTIVVGASAEDGNAVGVNGDPSDNSASRSGAAYVFVRQGTTWSQQAYLKASNTAAGEDFGSGVSVSGDTIVVGAPCEDSNATGVNGNQTNNSADCAGAAYVFVRSGSVWSQQAYLKASNTNADDLFGVDVSISGDSVAIGAPFERSNATGVDGDQGNNSAIRAGAAYVFARVGSVWSQQAYLKASNAQANDEFSNNALSLSGDTLVVGSVLEDSGSAEVNGDQADNGAADAGAAYVFERAGSAWSQAGYLKASNAEAQDRFGGGVAVFEDSVFVGACGEDSDATDASNNSLPDSGAVYVFDLDAPDPTSFCDGADGSLAFCPCTNPGAPDTGCDIAQSSGGAKLDVLAQETSPQNRVTFLGTGYPAMTSPAAVVIRSPSLDALAPIPFGDGLRCIGTPVVRLGATLALGGISMHTFGHGAMSSVFYYQIWFRNTPATYCDPAAAFNLSNGRILTW